MTLPLLLLAATAAYCLNTLPSCGNYCKSLISGVAMIWRPECDCFREQLNSATEIQDNIYNNPVNEEFIYSDPVPFIPFESIQHKPKLNYGNYDTFESKNTGITNNNNKINENGYKGTENVNDRLLIRKSTTEHKNINNEGIMAKLNHGIEIKSRNRDSYSKLANMNDSNVELIVADRKNEKINLDRVKFNDPEPDTLMQQNNQFNIFERSGQQNTHMRVIKKNDKTTDIQHLNDTAENLSGKNLHLKRISNLGDTKILLDIETTQNENDFGDINSLVNDLAECVELHILKYTRKCNTTIPNLDKLESDITDNELGAAIQRNCKHVNNIMKTSIDEIKTKWFYKLKHYNYSLAISEKPKIINTETKKNNTKTHITLPITQTRDNSMLILTDSNQSNIVTNKYKLQDEVTDEQSIEYIVNLENTILPTGNKDDLIELDTTHFDSTTLPSINTLEVIDNGSANKKPLKNIYATSTDTAFNTIEPNNNHETVTTKTTSTLKPLHWSKNQNTTETISKNNSSQLSTKNRRLNKYAYIPIIKINSREYPNGTVSSEINGTELLPNYDFNDYKHDLHLQKKNTKTHIKQVVYHIIVDTPTTLTTTTTKRQDDSDEEGIENIFGRFYFMYGNKRAPVNFVQENDASINIGINATSMLKDVVCGNKSSDIKM